MSIARHESGPVAAARALASQIHPVFMLPPLASSAFGGLLASRIDLRLATVHAVAIFCAVYTAHVKDGYVDFYAREEDDDHPMTRHGCRIGLVAAGVAFTTATVAIALLAGPLAAGLTLPTWVIGYLHAPQLDTHPLTTTLGYPTGIALAILGGYAVQTGTVAPEPIAFAGVFLITLAGVKVIDDSTDYDYDTSIDKRTVAVVLGRGPARRVATGLMGIGMFAVILFTVDGLFPPATPLAVVAFGSVSAVATRKNPRTATMLLVRGAYLFLAGLIIAVYFRPFAAVPLPDITVLGPYTYLATEVAFGSVALVLLYRSGGLRRAAGTIGVLYPVAYLWDWYTLEVGVFAILARTGVELFGIPLEEHLFIIVVPAFVLGLHETIHGDR